MDESNVRLSEEYAELLEENKALMRQLHKLYGWVGALQQEVRDLGGEGHVSEVSTGQVGGTALFSGIGGLKHELEAIRNSTSWRVTRPMRAFMRFIRRIADRAPK